MCLGEPCALLILAGRLTRQGGSSAAGTSDSALLHMSLILQQGGLDIFSWQRHRSKKASANTKASKNGITVTSTALSGPRQVTKWAGLEEWGNRLSLCRERNGCFRKRQGIGAIKALSLPQCTRNYEIKIGKYESWTNEHEQAINEKPRKWKIVTKLKLSQQSRL